MSATSRIIAIRSIPLSRRTANAWRNAGVRFWPRNRKLYSLLALEDETIILNLGNSQLPSEVAKKFRTYNPASIVRILSSPALTRNHLGILLPPPTLAGSDSYWIKGPGSGGKNKRRYANCELANKPTGYDLQAHIEGTEYRVNTVEHRVVQVHRRQGTNTKRTYEWCGLGNTPKTVKNIARQAAALTGRSVLAWDIILSTTGTPYILEGNTCPGVNFPTAERIVHEIRTT